MLPFFRTRRPVSISRNKSCPSLTLTFKILAILLLYCFLAVPRPAHAFGEVAVSFTGPDFLHISYSAQPSDWDTLYPDITRRTTDIVLMEYKISGSSVVETTLASGSGGIQGEYRLTGMGTDTFKYRVTEYYETYNESTGEWEEGSWVRRTIDGLTATREISGTLLFTETFDGGGATDISWGMIVVPDGKALTLSNMNPASGRSNIGIGAGTVTLEGCTDLDLQINGNQDSQFVVRNECIFSALSITSVGQVSIGSATFLKGCTPVIGHLAPVGSLSVNDSTFLDGGNFVTGTLCRIDGCDFLRGMVEVDTRTDSLSILNNVFADTLRLKIPNGDNPLSPVPTISGNSFVGRGSFNFLEPQVLSTIDELGNVDSYQNSIALANNYWGGKNGPVPEGYYLTWLGQWGTECRYYNDSDAVLSTGSFHAAGAPTVSPPPPPVIWVEKWRCGQNTLGYGSGRKGRDTLLCYDMRANVEEVSGTEFWITINGARIDPLNPGHVVERDYGKVPETNNMDRTLNFLLPADMTAGDNLPVDLYMDLTNAGSFDTAVGPTKLYSFSLNLDPPPARPLRLGIVRVDVRLPGFNPVPASGLADSLENILETEIPAMLPLKEDELEIEDLGVYSYDGGLYGNWVLNYFRPLLAHRVSWTLTEYLLTYNAAMTDDDKIDYLLAILPQGAFGTGKTGTNDEKMPNICLVTNPGAIMHELGHAVAGLHRNPEQYDLPGGLDTWSGNFIDEGVGAVIRGVTAFHPENGRAAVLRNGRRHFPEDMDICAWDIMSNNNLQHWVVPSTLSGMTQSLQSLLGTAQPKEGTSVPSSTTDSPSEESNLRDTESTGRRVLVRGLIKLYEMGYKMVPDSISCRRAEATMGSIPGEVSLISDWYQPYYDNAKFVAYDACGNEVFSAQCLRRDVLLPDVCSWVQTFDVPESAVKYEIREGRDGFYEDVVFSKTISPGFTTAFTGPTQGSQLSDRVTLSWSADAPAAPMSTRSPLEAGSEPQGLSHQLYYSTDGGSHWMPLGTPTYSTTIEIPTDFLPESNGAIAFKLVTSDGFQSVEQVLDNFSLANRPPAVTIVSPSDASQAQTGTAWTLSATALDPEEGALFQGQWSSNLDGDLGIDCTLSGVVLSEGAHTLTFTARDSQGLEGSAQVGVTVGVMETVDLRVDSQALKITAHGIDPALGVPNRIQVGTDNTISVTVQNQGIDNRATLEVFLTAPGSAEVSVYSETFDWTPFAQRNAIFQHLASQEGTYIIRARITCDSMTDPVPENDEYIWTFANEAPMALGDLLTVEENGTVSFDLNGYDPDGDELDFAIVDTPLFGNVTFFEYDPNTLEAAHYEYSSTAFGGTDSFTFTASDDSLVSDPATVYVLVTPLQTVPATPDGITATDGTLPDAIQVTWSAVPDATGYELYRSNEMNAAGSSLLLTTVTATTATDTGVVAGQYYYYWVKAVNDAGSSDFSPLDWGFVGENPRRFWAFETGGAVSGSPAVADDGTLYIELFRNAGDPGILWNDYYLHALTPAGDVLWTFNTGSSTPPAMGSDGLLYFSNDSYLYAYDPAVPVTQFTYPAKWGMSTPALGPGPTVYVNTKEWEVYAIDMAADDQVLWSYTLKEMIGYDYNVANSPPAVGTDGTVYSGFQDGSFLALNGADGTPLWAQPFQAGGVIEASASVGALGLVYVGATDGKVYALRQSDGDLEWSFDTGVSISAETVIGPNNTVYVVNDQRKVFALDGATGTEVWAQPFQAGGGIYAAPAVAADGTVYVTCFNGYLYALSGLDGNLLWSYDVGAALQGAPAIGPDGTVYLGCNDKKLYALNGNGFGLADSPWPKFRGDAANSGMVATVEAHGLADILHALQVLSGKPVDPRHTARLADTNQDGRIGPAEILRLLQETAEVR